MAHEISITSDGTAEAAFAGVKPWHGLGAKVKERMTAQEALDLAHLRWSVEKRTLWLEDGTDIPDKVAICRGDTGAYLGTVGPDWIPVQNEEQARFVEALAGAGGVVECLGALKGGRRTFWTVKVPGELTIGREDAIERYLIVANGHDGGMAFRAFWSPIRVVCQNTLNASLRKAKTDGITLRHTSRVTSHLDEARQVLKLADAYYLALGERFKALLARELDGAAFGSYLDEVFPLNDGSTEYTKPQQAVRASVVRNFEGGRGAELAGRTAWGAYNAVTEYLDHQRTWRGETEQDRRGNRFEALVLGYGKEIQQRAFDAALALA